MGSASNMADQLQAQLFLLILNSYLGSLIMAVQENAA